MKRYRLREQMNGIAEPPGKVWFWELEAGVIHADRCIQCGTCVAVCPSNSIGIDEDTEPARAGQDVHRLLAVLGLLPARRPPLRGAVAAVDRRGRDEDAEVQPAQVRSDSSDTYWKISGGPPADGLGAVVDSYAVRASAQIDDVQDGGAVSALLIGLLAAGEIDGALVSKPSADPDEQWKGIATIATTADEIRAASGSFYNQTMALAELDLSRYALPAKPRIAVVGTPCEVQGLRAMQARRWPTGAHRVDAVVLTIALMCTKNFDYEALTLRELRDKRGVDLDRVSKMDVIRGRMIVEYRDGELAVDEPVKDFHGAALKGCDECADFLGRSADISVGSVGSMNGWTSVHRPDRARAAGLPGGPLEARRARAGRSGRAACGWTRWTRRSPTEPCSASSTPTRRSSSTSRSTCAPTRDGPPAGLHPPLTVTDRARCCTCPTSPRRGPSAGSLPSSTGATSSDVLTDDDGVVAWLWSRWRFLAVGRARARTTSGRSSLGYRREIWLWLAGERTWAQCCSGLIGRITRRIAERHAPGREPGRQPPAPVLALSGVTVRRDGVPVLAGVDWRVDAGERWVVLGPNGSGKTTLLQVAAARLWPTAGTVEVLGARLGRVDVRTLRPRVALVSGAVTRQLRADLTAREVVVSGRHGALETWWNRYTAEDWEKADRLLARGGVGEHRGPPVRRDLRGRAPAGPPGPGADERPRAGPAGRALRRPRPRRPGAAAGPAGRAGGRPRRAPRSSW